MTNQLKRGEVWLADLNPTQGSEQAGIRPIIIFQSDIVSHSHCDSPNRQPTPRLFTDLLTD